LQQALKKLKSGDAINIAAGTVHLPVLSSGNADSTL
jgi:hypothetical protein